MGEYTYNCENCGLKKFELNMKDIPLKICPICQGTKIDRIWENGISSVWKTNGAYSKQNIKD